MSENADGCTSLEERNFEHEPNRTLPWHMLPTFFVREAEGAITMHHYLYLSVRDVDRGGLDLALMELSDIPHDEVLAEGTRPEATDVRRATSPR
jgi:hypothetical protein